MYTNMDNRKEGQGSGDRDLKATSGGTPSGRSRGLC